jgi:hypothetical protein
VRLAAVVVFLALPAGADVELGGRPSLHLSTGYDDNLFLDAQPSGPNPAQIRADAIFDVAPRLLGWLEARRHLLTLSVDYLERITPSNGDLRDAGVALGWRTPSWGPIWFSLVGRYEHWTTTLYPEDTFDLGGVEAGARLRLHERVALQALYRFAGRAYSDPSRGGQLDLDQRAGGGLEVRAARWLRLNAAYTFLHIGSNNVSAELERHRVELSLEATPLDWLTVSAGYAVAPQHLPEALLERGMSGMIRIAPRDDLLQWFDLVVTARPLPWLEVFARYSLLDSASSDKSGNYRRNQVLAGAGVRWDFVRLPRPPLAPSLKGSSVTFRHHAPPGHRVEIVGDWNGWSPQPLVEKSPGMYEATYTVPGGRHEYGVRVDGQNADPADAPAYVPDGFGGRSGVLNVE